jgi:hypothetical protein
MGVDDVELAGPLEDRKHRREEPGAGVTTETGRPERLWDGGDQAAGHVRVGARERRDRVPASYQFGHQLMDDPFRAAVSARRDTLERRGDLGDAERAGHRSFPGRTAQDTAAIPKSGIAAVVGVSSGPCPDRLCA